MTTATLTMVWLVLAAGQAAGDMLYTNHRNHRIPIDIQPERRQEIQQLLLFASSDQGRSWQQVSAIGADKDSFVFYAPGDGQYWLRVAALNRQGKQEPSDLNGPPDQKMVIDTVKPVVRIASANRQGDEVLLAWEIQEENADLSALKIEYQEKGGPSLSWAPVPGTPQLMGRASFHPATRSPLVVRVQLRDLAGNVSLATAEVPAGYGIQQAGGLQPGAAPEIPPPSPATPSQAGPMLSPAPLPPNGTNQVGTPPPVDPFSAAAKVQTPPPVGGVPPSAAVTIPPPAVGGPPPLQSTGSPSGPLPEASTEAPSTAPPTGVSPGSGLPRRPLPPTQITNSPEVVVEYELSKVGPSGIGSIDLYWTRDDGQKWAKFAEEPEISKVTPGVRLKRTINNLPGDGIYGFSLVVKSKVGRGKQPPQSGDPPDIRIEVDTQPPVCLLYPPEPDIHRPGAMVLKWSASDKNLASLPITLEWSERREGPWQPIISSGPNSGRHSWKLPEHLPVAVYLRLHVRDQAGNERVYVTRDAQVMDLSEPEGRIFTVPQTRRP